MWDRTSRFTHLPTAADGVIELWANPGGDRLGSDPGINLRAYEVGCMYVSPIIFSKDNKFTRV